MSKVSTAKQPPVWSSHPPLCGHTPFGRTASDGGATIVARTADPRPRLALSSADGQGSPSPPPRLPAALGRRDRKRTGIADQPARHPAPGRQHAARHHVRNGPPDRGLDCGLSHRRAPGRSLGGSGTAPSPHDRHRPGTATRTGLHSDRLLRRRPDTRPTVRRHVGQWHSHRLFRRRLPVLPSLPGRSGTPRGGQCQTHRKRGGGGGGWAECGGWPRSVHREFGRCGGRRWELLDFRRGRRRHPHARTEAGASRGRAPQARSGHCGRPALRLRQYPVAGDRRPPPPPPTCSAASRPQWRLSSWSARSMRRRG